MRLTVDQIESAYSLWDEMGAFPTARAEDALTHLMQSLACTIDADDVVWVGAARIKSGAASRNDSQLGWRALALRRWKPDPLALQISNKALREQDTDFSLTTRALAASAGTFRVNRLRDGFVDFQAFRRTPHYRVFYEQAGLSDRMFVGMPVNRDAECFLLFDRFRRTKRFSRRDAAYVAHALRGLRWFQRELLLSRGLLLAGEPLSAMEQRIVSLLLTEKSEKEIAAELGHSPATTHKYITGILRKFGVSGRLGLLALWLGRQG